MCNKIEEEIRVKELLSNIGKTAIIFFFSVALTIVIFVTGAQLAIYSDIDYYQKEYEKYQVVDDLDMEMEDVMAVTYEMMDYLVDKRVDLDIDTKVDGEIRQFFSEDEKIHMLDVKNIFVFCLALRRVCLTYMIFSVLLYLAYIRFKGKFDYKKLINKLTLSMLSVLGVIIVFLGITTVYACIDFTEAFTIFHEILFTNDLWLMDPDVSLLINMLPEGFFMDMAFRILGFISIPYCIILVIMLVLFFKSRAKTNKQS